ncbi:hypothetical protein TNCV_562591 [Trichonephila clavipes]|nr:hypothetical protein TNCV_562591 [Trichonephila clavipes]
MHYMYDSVNGDKVYLAQFPGRQMLDHRVFQRLHRQLRETRLFQATRHDAGQEKIIRSPSLEESILNVEAVRPELSTRVVALGEEFSEAIDAAIYGDSNRPCDLMMMMPPPVM